MKITLEGIKSRLDAVIDWISNLHLSKEQKTQYQDSKKKKGSKK